jgi:hypothetical protein
MEDNTLLQAETNMVMYLEASGKISKATLMMMVKKQNFLLNWVQLCK